FATGVVATFQPLGIAGLEIGGTRFFEEEWPKHGFNHRYFTQIFEGFFKSSLTNVFLPSPTQSPAYHTDVVNQLASLFFRWATAPVGFELHGEFGREDHASRARDLIAEPDHSATLGLGFCRGWQAVDLWSLCGELMNYEPSTLAL